MPRRVSPVDDSVRLRFLFRHATDKQLTCIRTSISGQPRLAILKEFRRPQAGAPLPGRKTHYKRRFDSSTTIPANNCSSDTEDRIPASRWRNEIINSEVLQQRI
jgi:hypothetical protein